MVEVTTPLGNMVSAIGPAVCGSATGDVRRHRALMLTAIMEKLVFGVPGPPLYAGGRVGPDLLAAGVLDLVLGLLFGLAYRSTRGAPGP